MEEWLVRIGIDYTAAVNQGAGIGRYTRQLVQALLDLDAPRQRGTEHEQDEYVLLAAGAGKRVRAGVSASESPIHPIPFDSQSKPNASFIRLPLTERAWAILWHRLHLPLWVELFSGRLDIFHSPDFALPPVRQARTVVTVHDLSFMRVPECSQPSLRAYLLRVVPSSVRRADLVLADSDSTRNDVIDLLGMSPDRVRVIYPGVDACFRRVQDTATLADVRQRYRLPERFVLSVGTLQPRKNFTRLIESYARAGLDADAKLVIAGGAGWMYEDIFRRVEELRLQSAVYFAGYVADEDLPALYTLADLFVFPSLYEGFGLPPLEAMACGTPVVTSNVSSLPEVVGNAALMVDPRDVEALANAMKRVLGEPSLRSAMVERGLAQARGFTWSRAAEELRRLYHEVR
jgi:glycosyltransferase involved in cell wall biosynthesis